LKPLLEYFDAISLSEEQVDSITSHLREIHKSESTFRHEGMTALRREQDKIQRRLSQIYDDKLDGLIDETVYLEKLKEFKNRQMEILEEMKRYEVADENFHITANLVLKLASRARELFESSEIDEKRQLLNLMFQNLQLRDVNLSVQVTEPFKTMVDYKECPTNWRWRESNTVGFKALFI
jgi:site-specific DNA recombinase